MNRKIHGAMLLIAAAMSSVQAQDSDPLDNGDYLAGSDARNSNQNQSRPVIGLSRKADYIVVPVSFTSDSRDSAVRTKEIHTMLAAALDKSPASGLELNSGTPILRPVTKENYKLLQMLWAGREDTSKVDILLKVPLTRTVAEVDKQVDAFIRSLPQSGRGTIVKSLSRQVAIRNPEQYRGAIVALIAEDVRRNAQAFGPDYRGAIDGLDKPVLWVQSNDTDVFLYLPYSYRIIAR
jgi:hypothetical protein